MSTIESLNFAEISYFIYCRIRQCLKKIYSPENRKKMWLFSSTTNWKLSAKYTSKHSGMALRYSSLNPDLFYYVRNSIKVIGKHRQRKPNHHFSLSLACKIVLLFCWPDAAQQTPFNSSEIQCPTHLCAYCAAFWKNENDAKACSRCLNSKLYIVTE